MTAVESLPPQDDVARRHPVAEDEISLIDLWLVLLRRKVVFALVALLVLVVGIGYALTAPKKYTYSTAISIGQYYDNDGALQLLVPPDQLQSEIKEIDLPAAIAAYKKGHPAYHGKLSFHVSVPRGSNLVVLSSKGPAAFESIYSAVAKSVTAKAVSSLDKANQLRQSTTAAQRVDLESQLSSLEGRVRILGNYERRLNRLSSTVKSEIASTKRFLNGPVKREMDHGKRDDVAGRFLAASQYWSAQQRLAQLQSELHVYLPGQQDNAKAHLSDLHAQIAALHLHLDVLNAVTNLQETQVDTRPRTLTGPHKQVIIVLSVVLAVMLGVLSAFVAEFIANARSEIRRASA